MAFTLLHQFLGFFHRGTISADGNLSCRIHFTDEAPALGTIGIVYHHHGHILQYAVLIYEIVQKRIAQARKEEYHYHAAIGEDSLELLPEYPFEIMPECFEISHNINPSCNCGKGKHSSISEAEAAGQGRKQGSEALPSTSLQIRRQKSSPVRKNYNMVSEETY